MSSGDCGAASPWSGDPHPGCRTPTAKVSEEHYLAGLPFPQAVKGFFVASLWPVDPYFGRGLMRLLQVVPHYLPAYGFGGPLRVAHNLGKALLTRGHKVTVCTTSRRDHARDLDVPIDTKVLLEGVRVFYEPVVGLRYWGFSPRMFKRIWSELDETDIVIVHAHYQFPAYRGAALSRYRRIPYLVYAHSRLRKEAIDHDNRLAKLAYLYALDRANLRGALAVVFNAIEEQESSHFASHSVVIPNAVDPAEFASSWQSHSGREQLLQSARRLMDASTGAF